MLTAVCCFTVRADHITGGEMYYNYLNFANGQHTYKVFIKLFMTCNDDRRFNDPAIISIFSKANFSRVSDINAPLMREERLEMNYQDPCITDPPRICYRVGYYEFNVSVPPSAEGFIISMQVVFRINGISNFIPNYNNVGATYISELPGNSQLNTAMVNTSARFTGNDLVVICANNSFTYDFGATDPDGDELRYSFCSAYQGGSGGFGNNPQPPQPPPYESVPYNTEFAATSPLGNNVRIDPKTGVITGLAPASGIYVVTVCVQEIRNGVVIATQRKDLQINITSCSIASASLQPEYLLCKESTSISITNMSNSSLIKSYHWTFFNAAGEPLHAAESRNVDYTFADTGVYKVRLSINRGQQCADSMESVIKVYPGMKTDFDYSGICISNPVLFTDRTRAGYGTVESWDWDFDLNNFAADYSGDRNPQYAYTRIGQKNIRLVTKTSTGCIDTLVKPITIIDKPDIGLAFRDTVICTPDELQLMARGEGLYRWTPNFNLRLPGSNMPFVRPGRTMTYYVDLDYQGCLNRDSVLVRVVDQVNLAALQDTLICAGDEIQVFPVTDALQFSWSPAELMNDSRTRNVRLRTSATTQIMLQANIGSCSAQTDFTVRTVPYPEAFAGNDTIICFNTPAYLNGSTNGISYSWILDQQQVSAQRLDLLTIPDRSRSYVFMAYDDKGCPKPGLDTVLVTVLDEVRAFAGRDTAVVMNQPLQLQASGGIRYSWSPPVNLSDPTVANPLVVFRELSPDMRYRLIAENEVGCSDTAFINIRVFNAEPSVFVPNAFTPNQDGINDELKFVAAGVKQIDGFRVYNRWGHLVYDNNSEGRGWDGSVNGRPQSGGTYVWVLKAIDFTGKPILKKGTVTLIR